MKTSFIAAVLLLALGLNPIAMGAGATKSVVKAGEDVAGIIPSKCDAVSENLVANCGFETGDFRGWSRGSGFCFCSVTQEARFSGNFGLEDAGGADGWITQVLPTVAGQQYSLSFWLWNTGQPNWLRVRWEGVIVYELVDAPDLPWTQVQLDGLAASQDGSEISFDFYNELDWWSFDDVVVVPYPK